MEAHHPDYAKPLRVIWLCKVHHENVHGKRKGISKFFKVKNINTTMEFKRSGRPPINSEMFEKIRKSSKKTMLILKSEWKLKQAPGGHMLRAKTKKNYSVRTLADDSGWLIKLIP